MINTTSEPPTVPGPGATEGHLARWLLLAAFILSGYAALTYEMMWVRQLVSLFGVTYHSITTILTVFMAGLALGSVIAGQFIDRLRLSPLKVFALLEVFLGLYAQAFTTIRNLIEELLFRFS